MTTKITAPFTPEQVANLNNYQQSNVGHPFTCGNPDKTNEDHPDGNRGALVATIKGWICPFCLYTQDWAHAGMADARALDETKEHLTKLGFKL